MRRNTIPIDFEAAFEAMPGYSALLATNAPQFTILATTYEYLQPSGKIKENTIGKGLFEAFPPGPHDSTLTAQKKLSASLHEVISTKRPHQLPAQRYDIPNKDGGFTEYYWQVLNKPILNQTGNVICIVHTAVDITDKIKSHQQQKKIKGLEQAYNLLMQAPGGICILKGEELVIALANDPALKLWGKNHSVIGQPLLKALPELHGQGFAELLRQVRDSGISYEDHECPVLLMRNGLQETAYFNFIYKPFYEEDNSFATGILVFGSEVTDKVMTTRKIQENEKRYRTLIEEATVATALYIGRDLQIQYVNDLMIGYWGKDHSVIGKTLLEAIPEIKNQPFPAILDKVYTTGIPYTGSEEKAMLIVDGKLQQFFYNYTYKPLRNEEGEIYGIHHMAIDVTEQVLDRRKTEESERKYRELSQSLEQKIAERTFTISQLNETYKYAEQTGNFGSYRYNFTTGEIIYSDNLYRLLGCKPGEFIPSPENFLKYIHPDDRDYVEKATAKVFEEHVVSKNEYRIIRKDGKTIHIRGTANIVHIPGGEKYMIGTLQDITDEKTKEQLLKEKNESLINMNKELESFAYISSHDLQEPLRKIQTFASRVIDSEYHKLSDNAKGFFERMQHAALRMQTLIDDLLAYSRTNSEERKYEKVHLSDIVAEIREELYEDLEVYHATIEAEELCEVNIIPFQFRQLMHNLIGNALKFSRHEKAPHIVIKSENDTGEAFHLDKLKPAKMYCHISISDNGIGFEPEYGEKIFEVFQRLHSRDRYKGTGIGLAIVKKIVENHQGVITATGEVNKGAQFDIYIPAAKDNLQQ